MIVALVAVYYGQKKQIVYNECTLLFVYTSFTKMCRKILSLEHIKKSFNKGGQNELNILDDVNFSLYDGDSVALTGASGTGKTTLLQIAGLIDYQTDGAVLIDDVKFCSNKKSRNDITQRDAIRRQFIGFVYQHHHLLPELTALENVMLPQLIASKSKTGAEQRARELLYELNLSKRLDHFPYQLSGGEQQRVAIARALANAPQIVIADEPTGNLDDTTAHHVFAMFIELTRHKQISTVVATHNPVLADKMKRNVKIVSGILVET
jgi:lipoprotein-releasing system ATP-binding protein